MAYSSVIFIFFFLPAVLVLFGVVSLVSRSRKEGAGKLVLLIVSIFFYAWATAEYVLLAALLVLACYVLGRLIGAALEREGAFLQEGKVAAETQVDGADAQAASSGSAPAASDADLTASSAAVASVAVGKKALLAVGIILCLSSLAFFKYWGFLCDDVFSLVGISIESVSAPLIQPLGISFLAFSLISYLMDVYRRTIPAERNLLNYLVWAFFFPKITQGPISRYSEMFGDDASRIGLSISNLEYGARRFVIGLAKKVLIADVLGAIVDEVFLMQATSGIDTPTAWLGIICYTFQIFFDFAGYSDMAIGLAAMFGFRLKENFNYPYISKTVGEFWRRWHISLSTWLRDYLYFPLGGSRRGNVYVNLAIVFLLSGLWHGASWHFVAWGAWYALFMIIDRLYRKLPKERQLPSGVTWAFTMLVVIFGWVLFRSNGMTQSFQYGALLFGIGSVDTQFFKFSYYFTARTICVLLFAALASTPIFAKLRERYEETKAWAAIRMIGIPLLFLVSVSFVVSSSYTPFLYAQF